VVEKVTERGKRARAQKISSTMSSIGGNEERVEKMEKGPGDYQGEGHALGAEPARTAQVVCTHAHLGRKRYSQLNVFIHQIRRHSGKHKHKGGIIHLCSGR